jgi:hypothetical protein
MAAVPDLSKLSPFDDPKVQRKQKVTARASFLAFNAVATRLLSDMARIYPTDATIRLLSKEMEKIAADKSKLKMGALVFFREIRKPAAREDGSACQYIDLLAAHSPNAFNEPIPVSVLQGAGLASKWKDMEPELRDAMWTYVDRLVHLSAQAVFSSSNATEEMNTLSRAVVTAAMVGHGNTPQELMSNPGVQSAASKFVNTVK